MTERSIIRRVVALASTAFFACSEAPEPEVSPADISGATQAILDGAPANDAKFAAVGALVFVIPELGGVVDVFCSGTLIAPRTLVTARHCTPTIDFAMANGLNPSFAFGPDALSPTHLVPITGYVAAPAGKEKGLLLDGGRDVAVAYLASAPVGIKPAKLGLFEDKLIGTQFQIAGFGVSDFAGNYGKKFAGLGTARATHGHWYELLFGGDYDAYLEWYFNDSPAAIPSEAEAREWWKLYKLEDKYELLAGGLPGEAVSCHGDSGGPLLRGTSAANLTTYGVSFAVEDTFSTVCGLGGGYLVFNRTMLDFVKRSL